MGHFDQIPSGRPNGFHLGPKDAWKGNQPSRRVFRPELFAIWAPRRLGDWVWTQDGGMTGDKKIVGLWRGIGRGSWRGRVGQDGEISVVAVSLKKKKKEKRRERS